MRSPTVLIAAVLALAGCPGGGAVDAGAVLQVTRTVRHYADRGVALEPKSTSILRGFALLPDGTAVAFNGGWADAGTARLEVASPQVLLEGAPGNFVLCQAPAVDVGFAQLGRLGNVNASMDGGTALRLQATLARNWQSTDALQLVFSNAAPPFFNPQFTTFRFADGGASAPVPDAGALDLVIDWSQAPLLDPDQGDRLVATHLVSELFPFDGGGLPMQVLDSTLQAGPTRIREGEAPQVSGSFSAVPRALRFTFDWLRPDFRSLSFLVHPDTGPVRDRLYVSALPFTGDEGFYDGAPDLLVLEAPVGVLGNVSGTVQLANPFPASSVLVAGVEHIYRVRFDVDGVPLTIRVTASSFDRIEAFTRESQGVQLTPPARLTVDGNDGTADQGLLTRQPTLKWDAPEFGAPDRYAVTLLEVSVANGVADVKGGPSFSLPASTRSLKLPPGVLKPATRYLAVVGAIQGGGPVGEPFRRSFPERRAEAVTGLLNVP